MPHVNSWETYQVKQEDWKPGVLKLIPFTWKNKKLWLLRKFNGSWHSQKLQKIMDCYLGWWNFPTLFNMNVLSNRGRYFISVSFWRLDRHFTWSSEPQKGVAACRAKAVPAFLRISPRAAKFARKARENKRLLCPRPPLLLTAPNQNRHATQATSSAVSQVLS